jgi:hypothetical protein
VAASLWCAFQSAVGRHGMVRNGMAWHGAAFLGRRGMVWRSDGARCGALAAARRGGGTAAAARLKCFKNIILKCVGVEYQPELTGPCSLIGRKTICAKTKPSRDESEAKTIPYPRGNAELSSSNSLCSVADTTTRLWELSFFFFNKARGPTGGFGGDRESN